MQKTPTLKTHPLMPGLKSPGIRGAPLRSAKRSYGFAYDPLRKATFFSGYAPKKMLALLAGKGMTPLTPRPSPGLGANLKHLRNMSFGLCRIRKISTAIGLQYTDIHNGRLYQEMGMAVPENIRTANQSGPYGHNKHTILVDGCNTIEVAVNKRIQDTGVKVRKNSVKAVEYVLALSPDLQHLYKNYSAEAVLGKMVNFVDKRHGLENIVSMSLHMDEANPHLHVVAVPIISKEKKWKNRNGEGVKVETTLAAREFFGTRAKLRELQTAFYEFCKNSYSERLNIEFKRGVDAREQSKRYTKHTSAELGNLRISEAHLLTQLEDIRNQQEQEQGALYKREAQQQAEKQEQKGKANFDKLNPFKNYPSEGKIRPQRDDKGKNKGLGV